LRAKIKSYNVVREAIDPVATICTVNIKDCIISETMLQEILKCTNLERREQIKNKIWATTNVMELNAFCGILLLAGAEKKAMKLFGTFFFIKFQIQCSTLR
jgi:hypothetical protein